MSKDDFVADEINFSSVTIKNESRSVLPDRSNEIEFDLLKMHELLLISASRFITSKEMKRSEFQFAKNIIEACVEFIEDKRSERE